MLIPLVVAFEYKFQLGLGPAFIIILVAALAFALRFPKYKIAAGGFSRTLRLRGYSCVFRFAFFLGLSYWACKFAHRSFHRLIRHVPSASRGHKSQAAELSPTKKKHLCYFCLRDCCVFFANQRSINWHCP